jgi:hypothetical protein
MDVSEFDSIHDAVESRYDEFEKKRRAMPERQRAVGGGHPFKLPLRDRLLMLLVYYRSYVTSILAGYLFDLDQSNVLKDIRMLEPLVKESLPLPEKIHKKLTRRLRTIEEVEEYFPGFKAFIDSTEQEIPRPKKEGREEEEDPLLGKEEEAYGQDAADGQLEGPDSPQDKPRSREEET